MYPKTVQIESNKLKELLAKKSELVMAGRAKSEELELVEKQMEEIDTKLKEEEAKVDISDLFDKEKVIVTKVEEAIAEMNVIKQEIYDRMKAQVPSELGVQYDELKKKKEDLEIERNKVAIKAQKYNDKIIPLAQEYMKPFLEDMYEDYDSLYLADGQIYATIFSHMNDFKTNFKKK